MDILEAQKKTFYGIRLIIIPTLLFIVSCSSLNQAPDPLSAPRPDFCADLNFQDEPISCLANSSNLSFQPGPSSGSSNVSSVPQSIKETLHMTDINDSLSIQTNTTKHFNNTRTPFRNEENSTTLVGKDFNILSDFLDLRKGRYTAYSYQLAIGLDGPYFLVRRNDTTIIYFCRRKGDIFKETQYDTIFIKDGSDQVFANCAEKDCGHQDYYAANIPLNGFTYPSEPMINHLEKFRNKKVVKVSEGSVTSDHLTYDVLLENGMVVKFDRKYNFPFRIESPNTKESVSLENLHFETLPQKPIDQNRTAEYYVKESGCGDMREINRLS